MALIAICLSVGRWGLKDKFYANHHCHRLLNNQAIGNFALSAFAPYRASWARTTHLNLFGYTGAASLHAAQAGAEVTHIDASKKAIAQAFEM